MRKLIAWLCVAGAALCIANLTWAGARDTFTGPKKVGALIEMVAVQDSLGASAVDTVIVDLRDLKWFADGAGNSVETYLQFHYVGTSGDTLNIAMDGSNDGSDWEYTTTAVANFELLPNVGAVKVMTGSLFRYGRLRFTAADDDSLTYTITIHGVRGR